MTIAEYRYIDIPFYSVVFGSIRGLWAIQSLGPGAPGNVRDGIGLRLDPSLVGHPTVSVLPISQHITQAEETVGRRLSGRLVSKSLHWNSCLVTGDRLFRLCNLYCQKSQLGSSLQIPGSFSYTRFLTDPEMPSPPFKSLSVLSPSTHPWLLLF